MLLSQSQEQLVCSPEGCVKEYAPDGVAKDNKGEASHQQTEGAGESSVSTDIYTFGFCVPKLHLPTSRPLQLDKSSKHMEKDTFSLS